MVDVTKKIKKKGTKLVLSQTVAPLELTDKDVLDNIGNIVKQQQETAQQMMNLQQQLQALQGQQPNLAESLTLFKKHEAWAWELQDSKAKVLFDELSAELIERVRSTYEFDSVLGLDGNRKQMLHQYRHYMATHRKVAEALSQHTIQKWFYKEMSFITADTNPFAEETKETLAAFKKSKDTESA